MITLTHTITNLKTTDAGSYECWAENYLNSSSQTVTFAVTPGFTSYTILLCSLIVEMIKSTDVTFSSI